MPECGKCGTVILVCDIPLTCGICTSVFHQRCTDVKKPAAKLLADYECVVFRCGSCLTNNRCARDGALDVGELKEAMEKIISLSDSFADIQKNIDAQINIAVAKGIDELIGSFNDVLRDKLASFETSVAKKLEDSKSCINDLLREKLAGMNRKRTIRDASVCSQLDGKPRTKKHILTDNGDQPIPIEIDESNNEDEVFESDSKLSYANVVSRKTRRMQKVTKIETKQSQKDREPRPVIVIKPVESSRTNEETRAFLKTKLNPKMHKISNFRDGKDGSIIVECAIGDNVETVKNNIESNLGGKYSAVIPSTRPKIKISGMSDRYSSDEFIDLLKSQNDEIGINDVKVIAEFENPRLKYNKYNVIIEVDKDTYQCLMTAGRVSIGWDKCFVYEAFNVLRCFKCGEFGHKSTECKNEETCSRCNGRHKTSECSSTELKCVNCKKTNENRKLNLDINHPAFSTQCPVYLQLLEKKKKQLFTNK